MFVRMLKQSLVRGRKRKLLAILTILCAAALITALMNVSIDVGDKMTRELKAYGANITLLPKSESIPLEIGGVDYNPLKGQVYLEEKDLARIKDIFWRHNIVGFTPFLKAMMHVDGKDKDPVQMIGTYFLKNVPSPDEPTWTTGVREIYPYWHVQGDWPDDEDMSTVLAGAALAKRKDWNPGDTLLVRPQAAGGKPVEVVIKGILTTGGQEENSLVAPLALVQKLTGLEGKVQSASVSALTVPEDSLSRRARRDLESLNSKDYDIWYCTAYVGSITHQLEEELPNVVAKPVWQVAASEGAIIGKIQLLMAVVTIAAFLASGLGISSLMSTTILERAGEIGLIKALGAANWEVYVLFLAEAIAVGLIGGLIGWIIGTGLSELVGYSVFGQWVSVKLIVLPVIMVISALIAFAGSLVPSRMITRLYPAEVLHGRR
jgi:putative ABC transport system permease protein